MCHKYIVLPKGLSFSKAFSLRPDPLTTLWHMLGTIPDPRRAQGKRHSLPIILTLAILALCSGNLCYEAISEWCVNYQKELLEQVPFLAKHMPDASTFQRVFARTDEEILEKILGEWIQAITPLATGEGIAIDGKEIHGTGLCLVAAFAHIAKIVLFEQGTNTKGKELIIGPEVLKHITVKDHIITGDALFAQRSLCELITKRKGGYLFRVKGNQEQLEKDIRLYFADLPFKAQVERYKTVDGWKGQIEVREVTVSTELTDYLNWPGLTHIWQMRKTVTKKDKEGKQQTTTEVSVGIARIPHELLGQSSAAEKMSDLIRGHWTIEIRLHRTRDTIFNEDHGCIRKGNAPNVMAALRNLVINLFHRATVRNFKTAQRRFTSHPDELFTFLGLTTIANQYMVT